MGKETECDYVVAALMSDGTRVSHRQGSSRLDHQLLETTTRRRIITARIYQGMYQGSETPFFHVSRRRKCEDYPGKD